MRVVSSLLKRVVYPCLAGAGYFRSLRRTGIAVITYHGVVPADYRRIDAGLDGSLVTAESFRQQLQLLKSNYHVISPEEMFAWFRKEYELPPRAVLITCDDGLANNFTEMLPALLDQGLRCLFFVTGASASDAPRMLWYQELLLLLLHAPEGEFRFIAGGHTLSGELGSGEDRRRLWWKMVGDLSRIDSSSRELFLDRAQAHFGPERSVNFSAATCLEARSRLRLLTRSELQQVAAAGMTIGAHTMTHPLLAQQPPELAWSEITECRDRLELALDRKIWAFAYPFGQSDSVSPQVVSMVHEAGFAAAFMNIEGEVGAEPPMYAVPRIHVNADMSLAEFEAHISGFYGSLQRSFGRRATPIALDFNSNRSLRTRETVTKQKTA